MDLVSLDIETTGLNPDACGITEVALVSVEDPKKRIHRHIDPGRDAVWDNWSVGNTKALAYTSEGRKSCLSLEQADVVLSSWMRSTFGKDQVQALGWNVGGFDLVFLRKYLPKTWGQFSYRTVDLTTMVHVASVFTFSDAKARVAKFRETWGLKHKGTWGDRGEHHAEWDARVAVAEYDFLLSLIQKGE